MKPRLTVSLQGLARQPQPVAADVVSLEFAIERGPADAQHLAGERLVTLHLLKNPLNGGALYVLQV